MKKILTLLLLCLEISPLTGQSLKPDAVTGRPQLPAPSPAFSIPGNDSFGDPAFQWTDYEHALKQIETAEAEHELDSPLFVLEYIYSHHIIHQQQIAHVIKHLTPWIDPSVASKQVSTPLLKVRIYNSLGLAIMKNGTKKEAKKCFNEASELIETAMLQDEPIAFTVMENQGQLYSTQRKYRRALQVYTVLYRKMKEKYEDNNAALIRVQLKIAEAYYQTRKLVKATAIYEDLLVAYQRLIPENDPAFVSLLNQLAKTYQKCDQPHRAYVYLRWAYEVMNSGTSDNAALAVEVITNLADVSAHKGDNDSAMQYYAEANELRKH